MTITPRTERTAWILVYIVIIIASFVAIWQIKSELTQTQKDLVIAQQQLGENSPTVMPPPNDTSVIPDENDTFTDTGSAIFTPISGTLLMADLLQHPELIPYEGVLGGTMNFYDEDSMIVGNKWVMAYFEDGHIGWYALLSYTGDKNNISWTLLDSYIL